MNLTDTFAVNFCFAFCFFLCFFSFFWSLVLCVVFAFDGFSYDRIRIRDAYLLWLPISGRLATRPASPLRSLSALRRPIYRFALIVASLARRWAELIAYSAPLGHWFCLVFVHFYAMLFWFFFGLFFLTFWVWKDDESRCPLRFFFEKK